MQDSTKKFKCATLQNNRANKVEVESAYVRALPGFSIVGMASQSIQESRDSVINHSYLYNTKVNCTNKSLQIIKM